MASGNDSRIKGRTHGRTDHQVHTLTKPLANGEPSTHGRHPPFHGGAHSLTR